MWSAKGRTPYIRPASTEGWIDALLVAAGTSLLGVFRLGLVGRLPSMWVELMERVPRFIRYALALIFGILAAYPLVHLLCSPRNFRPVLAATFTVLVMFYLLFPAPLSQERAEGD